MIRGLIDFLGWRWHWRGRCPKTVEEAVGDFLKEDKNPQRVIDHIKAMPESAREDHEARALRERIELIYGLKNRWNRALLRACRTDQSADAARVIFDEFWVRARSGQ